MTFGSLIFKNLFRHRARTIFMVLGVGCSVALMISLLTLTNNFETSMDRVFSGGTGDLMVIDAHAADQLSSSIPVSTVQQIAAAPHVAGVHPFLFDVISLDEPPVDSVLLMGRRSEDPVVKNLTFTNGRSLNPDDKGKVILGEILASKRIKVGDIIKIRELPFEVVGIFRADSVVESAAIFMSLADLQKTMSRDGEVTGFVVMLDPSSDKEAAAKPACDYIESLKDPRTGVKLGLQALSSKEFVETRVGVKYANALTFAMSFVAFLLGSLIVLNPMAMSVFERFAEIGLFRAVGWSRGMVVRMIMSEAVLISLAGAVVGSLMGFALIMFMSVTPPTNRIVASQIPLSVFLKSWSITLAIGFTAGIYPAIRAARILPAEGVRHA